MSVINRIIPHWQDNGDKISPMTTKHFRKSTIKEVATLAGVSVTTVSQFVGGRTTVCAAETADRIRNAVAMLHYTPSSLTGGLRRRATRTIGICVVGGYDCSIFDKHPFSEQLWAGITREANDNDYSLLYYSASVNNSDSCNGFLDGRVDGVLFYNENGNARLEKLMAAGLPFVVTVRHRGLPDGFVSVSVKEEDIVSLAVNHLWKLGHRRIAHLTGPCQETGADPDAEASDDIAESRYQQFAIIMSKRGVFDPTLIASAHAWRSPSQSAIAAALARWQQLAAPPTAVFCANDRMARIVADTAEQMNWQVPQRLSVVGVDDETNVCVGKPALTTVRVPVEEIGQKSVATLIHWIETGSPNPAGNVEVPVTNLILRESTAPPPI